MDARQTMKTVARDMAEKLLQVYLSSLPRSDSRPEAINRILVFAYHGLGNFIMYTPALKLLRERFPKARIDLQVGNNTGCEEVLEGANLFDNIYNLPYGAGLRFWWRRLQEIRATQYDVTINEFHSHSWKLALVVAFSGARQRLGHVTSPGWSEQFSRYSFVFSIPVEMREDEHETERYLDLVSALGAPEDERTISQPFIHLTDADRQFAEKFVEAKSLAKTIIGIQPGTSPAMRWKQWALPRYRSLLERLIVEQPDARMILFGSPGEAEMIGELARDLEAKVTIAAGKTSIKQVAALIERCQLLVCNDSGLMHVAVAVGTPVVAIYGPTDLRRTAPLGHGHTIIRHDLPCSPCFKLEGDEQVHACTHHDCLTTISPEEVFEQVKIKLQRIEEAPSQVADGAGR